MGATIFDFVARLVLIGAAGFGGRSRAAIRWNPTTCTTGILCTSAQTPRALPSKRTPLPCPSLRRSPASPYTPLDLSAIVYRDPYVAWAEADRLGCGGPPNNE